MAVLEVLNFDFWRQFQIWKCSKFPKFHFLTVIFYVKSNLAISWGQNLQLWSFQRPWLLIFEKIPYLKDYQNSFWQSENCRLACPGLYYFESFCETRNSYFEKKKDKIFCFFNFFSTWFEPLLGLLYELAFVLAALNYGILVLHSVKISGFFCHSDFTWNQFWRMQKFKNCHFVLLDCWKWPNRNSEALKV